MLCRRCDITVFPLNQRLRIDDFRNFVRLKSPANPANIAMLGLPEMVMPVDSYNSPYCGCIWGKWRRKTFIGFDGFAILEQHLVSATQFRFAHKYDDTCGESIQNGAREQCWLAILFPKSVKRQFARNTACAARWWREFRFVNHDHRIVLVKNLTHRTECEVLEKRNDASSADSVDAWSERLLPR